MGRTDQSVQTDPLPRSRPWMYGVLAGLATIIAWIAINVTYDIILDAIYPRFIIPPDILENLGVDGVILFRQHDRDSSGALDLYEFEPLAHRLLDVNETYNYDSPIGETEEMFTVQTAFTPLELSSMSKDLEDFNTGGPLRPIHFLRRWKNPTREWQNFAARDFKVFLPKDAKKLNKVGSVYQLCGIPEDLPPGAVLSANRYFPPRLTDPSEILIHRLITAFHSKGFILSRFQPQGSTACIRAISDDYVDIVFRVHAEFQLNEAPFSPFWFTPSQFAGHIIMTHNASKVLAFTLAVPTHRRLNVDMEWLTGTRSENGDNMEVDIGYISKMSLHATGPSRPAVEGDTDLRNTKVEGCEEPEQCEKVLPPIAWTKEISTQEAQDLIEVRLYPFKQVPYYNLSDAFDHAEKEQKLVHSILLWGALDDQSC